MIDREYAEMADVSEDKLYEEEITDEDVLVDEEKDDFYYKNRMEKGYGLV